MWTIAKKEMMFLLFSPRFILMSITAFILVLLAMFVGYANYELEKDIAVSGEKVAQANLAAATDLTRVGFQTIRQPVKLSIFDIGVTSVLGRLGETVRGIRTSMKNSPASTDPSVSLFGGFDLTFIVAEIMALLALLFSYDGISGEKESGTLKAVMANSISRTSIFFGKVLGAGIPVVLTFLVPFLAGLAVMLIAFNINFTGQEWIRLGAMAGTSILYLAIFTLIGITASSLSRSRFTSLMLCLLFWVVAVAIFPSLVIQGVTEFASPMSKSEFIEHKRAVMRDDSFRHDKRLKAYLDENPTTGEQWSKDNIWEKVQMQIDLEKGAAMEKEWNQYELSNKQAENSALLLSIISPTAAYRNIQHALADTGPAMLGSLNEARVRYEKEFSKYAWEKALDPNKETHYVSALKYDFSDENQIKAKAIDTPEPPPLDLSQMPQFKYREVNLETALSNVIIQLGSLLFSFILFLAISYVVFLRYDVR